ncbi:hypothetical protein OG288_42905 [Streptomyces tauricus]|uniref:Uncharacterized protein n=1 Tax=Streptomyces tauricus TaxID=68274 RepID=A0ABZ1JS45_9ACTN|nr:hypothetical protein [Streptomyces tauricus]
MYLASKVTVFVPCHRAGGRAQIMQLRATAPEHRRAHHRAVKAEAKDSS